MRPYGQQKLTFYSNPAKKNNNPLLNDVASNTNTLSQFLKLRSEFVTSLQICNLTTCNKTLCGEVKEYSKPVSNLQGNEQSISTHSSVSQPFEPSNWKKKNQSVKMSNLKILISLYYSYTSKEKYW